MIVKQQLRIANTFRRSHKDKRNLLNNTNDTDSDMLLLLPSLLQLLLLHWSAGQSVYYYYIFGPGRVPKRYFGCSCSCCYRFRKMPTALLIRNGKLRNFAYTFVTSFPTDLPSQIFTRWRHLPGPQYLSYLLLSFQASIYERLCLCFQQNIVDIKISNVFLSPHIFAPFIWIPIRIIKFAHKSESVQENGLCLTCNLEMTF